MARTSSTEKTTAPAKKTAARKTTAAKKPASPARKTPAKKTHPKAAPTNTATVVDLRKPLPVRRTPFIGPMGVTEQAAIRAALAAATAQLPIPVRAWHGPTAHLTDGTTLTHTPAHATTDHTPTFTAAIRCPHGAVHPYTIHTAFELHRARLLAAQCDQRTDTAPATPAPNPAVRTLADATDTQPLNRDEIAAGIAARADHDQPKEHPDHA